MRRILRERDVEAAVKGGAVFAAGGGGWADHGRMLGTAAVNAGEPELVTVDEIADEAWIATAAAIGAPAGTTQWQMLGVDYIKAVELAQRELGAPVYGLMIGQNGKSSTLNGWLPAAVLGTKVVDAVGDLRAHPTGDMGSIGLANSPEPMIQSAAGGNRANNAYIELVVRGATARISPILRRAADMSGGFIASCRNPVRASYVKAHAALGGISIALALGEAIIAAERKGGAAVIDAICTEMKGAIIGKGKVTRKAVQYTSEAFDIGTLRIGGGSKRARAARDERVHGGRGCERKAPRQLSRCDRHARPGRGACKRGRDQGRHGAFRAAHSQGRDPALLQRDRPFGVPGM